MIRLSWRVLIAPSSTSEVIQPRRLLGVLHNRDFGLLWSGLLVSSVGDWINYVAMVALVYQETHSALMLALLRLCHIVPILVIAPFAGVFVDRWPHKHTLVLSPLVSGLAAIGLAVYHPVAAVFAAYGVLTISGTFFNPARSACLPSIVSENELVPANSLSQITSTASIVLGGLTGGLIVAHFSPAAAFTLNGLSFLIIAALISLVRLPDTRVASAASSLRGELLDGLQYARHEPLVGNVVLAGAIFVFAPATVLTLGIAFAQTALHAGSAGYGAMLAGMGVGSALGAVAMIAYRNRLSQGLTFALSGIVQGIGVAALGLSHGVAPAALSYGLAGFAGMVNTVSGVTLLQRLVPDWIRGRIFAVSTTLDHLGAFASTMLVGLGGGLLGAAGLITISGLAAALTGACSLLAVGVRGVRRAE